MPKITQTESGKAWEYGLARNFADVLNSMANLVVNASRNKSQESYNLLGNQDRQRIDWAANEAVVFLRAHDPRLLEAKHVVMQGDMTRSAGDVRDILVHMPDGIIGISAKHRHKGLKHSRLSATIDFGAEWYGRECSAEYWNAVLPVFGLSGQTRRPMAGFAGQVRGSLYADSRRVHAGSENPCGHWQNDALLVGSA